MVRQDTYDVGELENTRGGDGTSPLTEWTERGYSIEDDELVKRVVKRKVKIVGWEYKRKAVGLTKFRKKGVVVGAERKEGGRYRGLREAVRQELRARGLDWSLREWWNRTLEQDRMSKEGRPLFKWGGTKSKMRQFSRFRWEPQPKKVREARNLREKVERKGKYNVKIMPAIPFPETEVEEEVEEERIPITRVSFKAVVSGVYIDSSGRTARRIDIEGTKTVEAGVVPPEDVEDEPSFWDGIWTGMRDEIFPHEGRVPGTTLSTTLDPEVNGVWINRIMERATGFEGSSDIVGALAGIPKNAKWEYWFNKKSSDEGIRSASDFQDKMRSEATEKGMI